MKRLLRWFVLALVWIGGTILGVTAAALRTEAGVRVVVQAVQSAVGNAIHGSLQMDSVDGTFSSGLEIWNTEIRGPDGLPFVVVSHLRLNYDIGTLLSRRFVLGELTIEDLVVDLMQVERGGPFNVDLIFAGDTMSPDIGVERSKPYLAFRDVRIVNASVIIRTPADPSEDLVEAERRASGYYRVRRIQEINAVLPFVRLVSPVPGQDPIAIDIESLAARISDPGFEVVRARGSAQIWGDSVTFAFDEMAFPESEAGVRGSLFWPTGPLQFNLQIAAHHVHTNDLTGLVGQIPRGLEGSGTVTVRSLSEDVLVMNVADMDLTGHGGGGRVTGTLGMQFWPDTWAQRATDLTLQNFDLEYVRHLLDTLPVAGRVTGRVATNGRRDSLMLEVDATFEDSLVGMWPETYFRGRGLVSLGVPGDFVFRDFELDSADISLETVQRLIPAIQLVGRIRGAGVLDGPWLQASYTGRIRHRDAGLPETVADGSVRIDATGEVVGVWATLAFDSLRLAGLHSSYPQLPSLANLAGPMTIDGYLDSVLIGADLVGPSGAVSLQGAFVFDGDRSGAHAFEIAASGVDASAYHPSLAPTSINGRVIGRGWRSDTQESLLETTWELTRSELRGVMFDAITGGVSLRDSLIVVDSLEARIGQSRLTAHGALGTAQPRRDRLRYSIEVDDISAFEPWIASILGEIEGDTLPLTGRVRVSGGELIGAVDAFVVLGDIQAFDISRGAVHVSRFGGSGTWASASKALRVQVTADSLRAGPVTAHDLSFDIQGRPDSLQWRLQTGLQEHSRLTGGGQVVRDSSFMRLEVDSLRAVVHTSHWYADSFSVELGDSAAVFRGIQLWNESGAGRIELDGRLPFKGRGLLDVSVRALPLSDVWALLGYDPADVSGQVAGTFSQSGTARDPIIEAAVLVTGGRFGEFSAPQMSGELRYRDRRVTGDLDLIRLGHSILQVELDVPYDLGIGSVAQRRVPGSLSITGRADSVDLSLFNAINPAVQNAVGTFDADLGIAGTWEEPVLTGNLSVTDGGATFPSLGVRHDSINGMIELVGDTIHVRALSLFSGRGTATVGGFVRLEELSKPILALTVRTDAFDAINVPGFLSLTTTGDVRFEGPVFTATMTGSATATRGVIYFADLITKEVVNLEDSLFVQDSLFRAVVAQVQAEGLGAAFENRFLDNLRIDSLDLSIGSEVWLRSGEANIQLTGAVLVDKVRNVYNLDGELQTPRGSYRLEVFPTVTREFTVTGGTVRYFGTSDFNAGLDIRARHIVRARGRAEDVDIFVNIGGTLFVPQLRLTSNVNPPLSDDEIMAYLLFGDAALDPGQMQAAEFASERLTQLVSGQFENLVISSMDVPLDYFQIRPAARGGFMAGAEVSLGKQFDILGRSAFVTATPRYCPRLASTPVELGASLEFRFSRRWLLEASVEPRRSCDSFTARTAGALDRQFGIDLIWEMSY